MALHSFWNPLRSYTTYKQREVPISLIDDYTTDDKMSSFIDKLKGTFFMFSGYLDDPGHLVSYQELGLGYNPMSMKFVSGQNHLGIFDYLTLGIPYFIESLFRGNFFDSKIAQDICQIIFSIIPIVPALATVRNGIGLIATIISSPVVLGIHIGDMVWNAYKTNKLAKKAAESAEMENDPNLKQFRDSYKALSGLFKQYKSAESMSSLADDFEMQGTKDQAIGYFNDTYNAATKIIHMEIESPVFFDRKIGKITLDGGKYSRAAIENKFGLRI